MKKEELIQQMNDVLVNTNNEAVLSIMERSIEFVKKG